MRRSFPRGLPPVCVTGTNGKTTTVSMLASIAKAAGEVPAWATTVGGWLGEDRVISDASDFDAFFRLATEAKQAGCRQLFVETTSRALAGGFAQWCRPHVAVFTNFSRDHLDYHETPEAYLLAKSRLFTALPSEGTAVLNADDAACKLVDEVTPSGARRAWFGVEPHPQPDPTVLRPRAIQYSLHGTTIHAASQTLPLAAPMRLRALGQAHAHNALAAALAAACCQYTEAQIVQGLESFTGAPGRFELCARRPLVVVDYAHTPHALEVALKTLQGLVQSSPQGGGKVLCLFGCGGDRDPGKRPVMGAVADALADVVYLTSDNNRSESFATIAGQVLHGSAGKAIWRQVEHRPTAIAQAVEELADLDGLLLAGRGHEELLDCGSTPIAQSDRSLAQAACEQAGIAATR